MEKRSAVHTIAGRALFSASVAAGAAFWLSLAAHAQLSYLAQLRSVYANATASDPLGIEPAQNLLETDSALDYGTFVKTATSVGSGFVGAAAEFQSVFSVAQPTTYKLTGALSSTSQGTLFYVQLFYIDWALGTSTYLHDFTTAGSFEGNGVLVPGYEYYVYGYSLGSAGSSQGLPDGTRSGSFDFTFSVPEPPEYAAWAALGLCGWAMLRRRCRAG